MNGWELGTLGWELAILRIIDSLQRTRETVSTEDIYMALEEGTSRELTRRDLREVSQWGRRPAYQYRVRSYLSTLARGKRPSLERVSRGVYRMTDHGKWRIRHDF